MRLFLGAVLAFALGTSAVAQDRAMIVLDASGSMWGLIDGKTKIEIARETMGEVLGVVPKTNELGLIVYGHRSKGDCGDIELAVPPAAGTAGAIADFVKGINPKGKTPLSAAVKQAAEGLRYTEDKATVILVTDGLETCDADPCALGRELEAAGVDFTAHVVGFGLTKAEGAQVACLAENTGGRYIEAKDAGSLSEALKKTVVAEEPPAAEAPPAPKAEKPEFNLRATASLIEGGPQLEEALAWEIFPVVNGEVAPDAVEGGYNGPFQVGLPAGEYELRARGGQAVRTLRVTLTKTEMQTPHVVLDASWLTVRARFSEGGDLANCAYLWVRAQDGAEEGGYTETRMLIPAGPAVASAELSKAKAKVPVEIVAGEEREVDVVLGAGVVRVSALYAPGGPAAESGIRFDVLAAKADINGNRDEFNGSYGHDALNVPAGSYILNPRLEGAEVRSEPFEVAPGELVEVQVVLNAGVAAMSAPGAYRIDVFGPPKITGEREELAGAYGDNWTYTLKAGTYRARASYEGDRAPVETDFMVTAGERVELTLQ